MARFDQVMFPVEPRRSRLLGELWRYQLLENHISDAAIQALALAHDLSVVEVEGVASFYHFFHRQPTARHVIYLDNSIVAEMKGAGAIREAFEQETGARIGAADPSGLFALFPTPCIGLSDQQPAALIDFYPFVDLTAEKVRLIVEQLRQGADPADICDVPRDHIRYLPPDDKSILWAPYERGGAVGQLSNLTPDAVLSLMEKVAMSGRGGAFYATWLKWDACRKQPATPKFIICNADEGEPGTFKDRVLLNSQMGAVLEGMIIAGYTVGARYGIIYLRGEYRWMAEAIQREIDAFQVQGLLGVDIGGIKGFKFDIRIEIGAGSYVCGEEMALLESLEGKRGEPRSKWYFPTEKGYLQLPTVVNNVETFSAIARLLPLGLDGFAERGIPGSFGTKLISISGDCRLPGIYEIEWGMTVGALLDACQAEDPFMIQVSGPSGTSIPATQRDRRICLPGAGIKDSLLCGGAFMIFNRQRDLLDILLNFAEFFKHESCGICTPCRAGNFILQRKLAQLLHGTGDRNDLLDLKKWAVIMEAGSRCGLGRTAGNAIIQTTELFRDYFEARVPAGDSSGIREFDLEAAVREYEQFKPSTP